MPPGGTAAPNEVRRSYTPGLLGVAAIIAHGWFTAAWAQEAMVQTPLMPDELVGTGTLGAGAFGVYVGYRLLGLVERGVGLLEQAVGLAKRVVDRYEADGTVQIKIVHDVRNP